MKRRKNLDEYVYDPVTALRDILNVLGPPCKNCCEGCSAEIHEARRIAEEASAR